MYKIIINLPVDEKVGILWVKKQNGGFVITNNPKHAKTFKSKRIMVKFIECYLQNYIPYKIYEL